MKHERLKITRTVIRRLDTLSGNRCAYPDCTSKMIAEDGKTVISKIAHITAASPNGPRYDSTLTDEERRGYDNLILLCDEHHTMIDSKENESRYTPDLLRQWKNEHEKKNLELVSEKNLLSKHPLALNKVINFISSRMDEVLDISDASCAPDTEMKISYNKLDRYDSVIREFAPYQVKLNKIYEEIELEGSTKKVIVLQYIKRTYAEIKSRYKGIDEIRPKSDLIFDEVIDRVWDRIEMAPNKLDNYDQETIHFALMIVIVDAFMRCDILEEPGKIL